MPYQNWYSAATNAAVDMNMPPALVPALNLRTAGRFDKETAMINPQETQRMMFGDQAFRNTRRITEERDMSKDYNFVDRRQTMTQGEMAATAGPMENYSNPFEGYENTSNPFSDQYSSLWS
jgi:hypothetical protein